MNTIPILIKIAQAGGHLILKDGKLQLASPPSSDPSLITCAREVKPQLLELLSLEFLMVRSDVLGAVAFWVQDEATRKALIRHGADPATVWTRDELAQVCGKRPSPHDLRAMVTARWKAGAE